MTNFETLYNLTDNKIKLLQQHIDKLSFNDTMVKLSYIQGLITALYIICELDDRKYVNGLSDELDVLTDLALEKILIK